MNDVLGTFMKNRNLPKEYLNITKKDTVDFREMRNMKQAVKMVRDAIYNHKQISVLVDCDVDGYTSAATVINYLEKVGCTDPQIYYLLHDSKRHGLQDDHIIIPDTTQLLIVPDAGSDDTEICNQLIDSGCKVLILDHHDISFTEGNKACIVSSQWPEYPNKELSGVGVVYKFLQGMDLALGVNYADTYLDLVALGNIADMMDIRSFETKYYIQKGLCQIVNPMFEALVEYQSFSITDTVPSIREIQFKIAPLINAMIRVGDMDEKELLFRAFLERDYSDEIYYKKKRGSNEEVPENIYQHAARLCSNAKSRQDNNRKNSAAKLRTIINAKHLDKHKILLCDVSGILGETLTGLTAQEISKAYNRPCLLMRNKKDDPNMLGGSGRNSREDELNFAEFLNSTNLVERVMGHPNAFGFDIKKENILPLLEMADSQLQSFSTHKNWEVDFEMPFDALNHKFFIDVHNLRRMIGKGIDDVLVHLTDIPVLTSNVSIIGQMKNTLKINADGVDIMMFNRTDKDPIMQGVSDMWEAPLGWYIEAVCSVSLNIFKGRITPQLIVEDYWITEEME